MHIICPHCTTSYAIDLATLGEAGRTVRCSRCKEVWLARPEDAIEPSRRRWRKPASRPERDDAAAEWERSAEEDDKRPGRPGGRQPVDLGRLAGLGEARIAGGEADWASAARDDVARRPAPRRARRLGSAACCRPPAFLRASGKPVVSLTTVCAAWARWCWRC